MDGLQITIFLYIYHLYNTAAFPETVTTHQNVSAVMVEGREWLFSFLQPAALQGGKMAEERKRGERVAGTGGLGSGRESWGPELTGRGCGCH